MLVIHCRCHHVVCGDSSIREVGGIRGLTSIANPASPTGTSLFFSYCPNGDSKGSLVRLDPSSA
eukprot:65827-Alexandrium_andersonii.AAC.1